MKMREEIDAMRTLGIDPMETLVLPRVLALIVMVPVLTFIGDLMCLLGGGMMARIYLGLDAATFSTVCKRWSRSSTLWPAWSKRRSRP